eukprot:GEMP01059055.1.p1 GENE.GEMP01059055.1~~GEMP01059055.1.p1  ORF type:complete len:225 (+),score=31.65 GEMP01059055.1:120-794(+)
MNASKRLDQLAIFLDKTQGRDKLGRMVQYFFRFLAGMCGILAQRDLSADAISSILDVQIKFRSVQGMISDARRTNRWLKQIPIVLKLPPMVRECLEAKPWDWVNILSKAVLSTFHTLDHVAWLRKVKVIPGDAKATMRYNQRFLLAANALQAIYQAGLYYKHSEDPDDERRKKKLRTIWMDSFRCLLMCVQSAHNGAIYETKEWICALSGVVTSAYDANKVWPR